MGYSKTPFRKHISNLQFRIFTQGKNGFIFGNVVYTVGVHALCSGYVPEHRIAAFDQGLENRVIVFPNE